jgi:hypothetical protein
MSDEHFETVNLDLSEAVQVGEGLWELPPWHTYWGRFVYPLLVANQHRRLFPLGTAFAFSKLNHVLTARHNVEEALRKHHPNGEQFVRKGLEAARNGDTLEHAHLAILSQGPNPKLGDVSLDLRAFDSMHAALPTDLLIGNMLHDESSALVPTIPPVITFAPPRIGETVHCVGYSDMKVPDGGLPIDDIRERRLNPYEAYSHRLLVAVGRVTNIFVERLTKGFVEGPCFTIDVGVPQGLSGGPILRSDGAICGVVYSGASLLFDSPASVGALLYPIFLLRLSFGISMANGRFQMKATERPVAELVATQAIRTDGAEEEQLHFTHESLGTRVGAVFHKEDAASIFEDFRAFQESRPMPALTGDGMRGFKPNLEHPLVKKRRGACD